MNPMTIVRRLLLLLGAVAAAAALVAGAHADEGDDAPGPVAALLPTQAIAEVPEEFGALFEIQWGGGTLYQLKARLATMGCMLNTIWIQAGDRWYGYNQYNVPPSLNGAFLARFPDRIPAIDLYGNCIDICTFDPVDGRIIEEHRCATFEEIKEQRALEGFDDPIDNDTPCTDDFDPRVKQHVFPILPLLPDTCVVRQETADVPTIAGTAGRMEYVIENRHSIWFIVIWRYAHAYRSEEAKQFLDSINLHTEIHELCHIQQDYHLMQQETPGPRVWPDHGWYDTEANRTLMKITGFTEIREQDVWDFALPSDSVFKEIYSTNPAELSAELCTLYLLNEMGEKIAKYEMGPVRYSQDFDKVGYRIEPAVDDFDVSRYLTPEIVKWLETYMILPRANVTAGMRR